ncbi:MAG: DegT/DnrJ/EryC1/StrS family aminotransferase [Planctomycetota bacterium]
MSNDRIHLSVPHATGDEERLIHEAFASNWLSSVGPHVNAFEEEIGRRVGAHAVAVSSGTAALHLGLRLLGVGPGDDVFCSTLTFVASANPILYCGAHPVFIDSERRSWNMDPEVLERALVERTRAGRRPRALVVVHLFGQCADMDPILEICARHDVPVIEDAAEALGGDYKGRPAGTLGDVGVFSFNGNKIITTTSGGVVVTRTPDAAARIRHWATQARDPGVAYEHSEVGYNYRLSNVLAAIGRAQLVALDERVARRREIAFRYRDAFESLPGVTLMPQAPWGLHTNWLSCFTIDAERFGATRDEVIARLAAANIESRPVWKPMHLQKLFETAPSYGGEVAVDLFRRGICLPSSSSMTGEQQERIIALVRSAARRRLAA